MMAKNGSTWGHTIYRFGEDELAARIAREEAEQARLVSRYPAYADPSWKPCRCRYAPKCTEVATHEVTYVYVTGRRGNTSRAAKPACDKHASAFRAKYEPVELDTRVPGQGEVTAGVIAGWLGASKPQS